MNNPELGHRAENHTLTQQTLTELFCYEFVAIALNTASCAAIFNSKLWFVGMTFFYRVGVIPVRVCGCSLTPRGQLGHLSTLSLPLRSTVMAIKH